MAALERLGELTEPAVRQALAGKRTPESRRRLEQILEPLDEPVASPEALRVLRAVEVLERLGTPEAEQVLQSLATGAPEARLTQEAKAALGRSKKPKATHP